MQTLYISSDGKQFFDSLSFHRYQDALKAKEDAFHEQFGKGDGTRDPALVAAAVKTIREGGPQPLRYHALHLRPGETLADYNQRTNGNPTPPAVSQTGTVTQIAGGAMRVTFGNPNAGLGDGY